MRSTWLITAGLVALAILAYLGRSLVMLASVGGIAVALWLARGRSLKVQAIAVVVGAVATSLAAEGVHLAYHLLDTEPADHGGFWVSAVLVGAINAAAMLPLVWWTSSRTSRRRSHLA